MIAQTIEERIAAARGFLFDLDGTLALGDSNAHGYKPLPGARELLATVTRANVPFAILTNGTHHTPQTYVEMLQRAGFDVPLSRMLTPSVVAAEVFAKKQYRRVLVLGVQGVSQPMLDLGIDVVRPGETETGIEAVFVGWHPDFALRDIEAACRAAWAGATLYTASIAPFFATRNGKTVGISGAICAAIKSVTQQRVYVLGKPSQVSLVTTARRLGVRTKDMVVVGDDPGLEIAMARTGGACAVGVTTGIATAETYAALPPERSADLVLTGVADLLTFFQRRA